MPPMTNAPNDDQFCQESWLSTLNRSRSGPEALYPQLFWLKQPRWRVIMATRERWRPVPPRQAGRCRDQATPRGGGSMHRRRSRSAAPSRGRAPEHDSNSPRGGGRRRDPANDDDTSSSSGDGIATRSRGGTASAPRGGGVRPQPESVTSGGVRTQPESVTMGMWLTENTLLKKYSPPLKGLYWDFGIIGVGTNDGGNEDNIWKFPNNNAVFLLMRSNCIAPHGAMVHRFVHCDRWPFTVDIAVAVKDTVQSVSSEVSLAWPDRAKNEACRVTDDDRETISLVCPAFHHIRIHLRQDSFMLGMIPHVDVGVIVAADRFSAPMWERAQKAMKHCDVCMVSTRGGGEMYVDDTRRDVPAAASAGSSLYRSLATRWVQPFDAADAYTTVGHNCPLPGGLVATGKKFSKVGDPLPMVWLRCHHSVKHEGSNPDTRRFKGTGKGKDKDNGKQHPDTRMIKGKACR